MIDLVNSPTASRVRPIAYWVTTILLVVELMLGGVWDLLQTRQVRDVIEQLGYPLYVLTILGIWKLLGAIAILLPRFPRLKEWAYAGVIFDLTGAVASQVAARRVEASTTAYPVLMIGIAVASWALRSSFRRLNPCPWSGEVSKQIERRCWKY